MWYSNVSSVIHLCLEAELLWCRLHTWLWSRTLFQSGVTSLPLSHLSSPFPIPAPAPCLRVNLYKPHVLFLTLISLSSNEVKLTYFKIHQKLVISCDQWPFNFFFIMCFRFVNSLSVESVRPVRIWLNLVVADGASRLAKRGGKFGQGLFLEWREMPADGK